MFRAAWLAAVLLAAGPTVAHAQLFFATRPHPDFMVGPLFIRASVEPEHEDVVVDVLFSLVVPPTGSAAALEQDLYLLWPSALAASGAGRPDPALARLAEQQGLSVIEEGRVPLTARNLYQRGPDGRAQRETIPGGAPFVTFVREGGGLGGISSAASLVRIPWNPKSINRAYLMGVSLATKGLIKPKPAPWLERTLWGPRQRLILSFGDVRQRGLFTLYFWNRDRVIKLSEDPSQLIVNFSHADRLKIDELFPQSARRQLHETLENTDVVSMFLDPSEGLRPQTLTVQFGYFSGIQSWAPVLIPIAFFALGNLAGPLVLMVVKRLGKTVTGRVHISRGDQDSPARDSGVVIPREKLARIVPGETRYRQVLELCGPNPEEQEQLAAPDRKTLVYRGRRVVPHRRRALGWLATVDHWDVEHHEVQIELERDVVQDIQARVRRERSPYPEGA